MNTKQKANTNPTNRAKLLIIGLAVEGLIFSFLSCGSDVERIPLDSPTILQPTEVQVVPLSILPIFTPPLPSSFPTLPPTPTPKPCRHDHKCKDRDDD